METNKRNYTGIAILLLTISILIMSIGFATRSQVLQINGNTTIGEEPKWDIHFEHLQVLSGTVSGDAVPKAAEITNANSTIINYDIRLKEKGDKYVFTVDVVNAGNIYAEVGSIELIGTSEYEKYVTHKVTYADSGEEVKVGDMLNKNSTTTYQVEIENIYEKASQYEVGEYKLNLSFAVEYIQKQ